MKILFHKHCTDNMNNHEHRFKAYIECLTQASVELYMYKFNDIEKYEIVKILIIGRIFPSSKKNAIIET